MLLVLASVSKTIYLMLECKLISDQQQRKLFEQSFRTSFKFNNSHSF